MPLNRSIKEGRGEGKENLTRTRDDWIAGLPFHLSHLSPPLLPLIEEGRFEEHPERVEKSEIPASSSFLSSLPVRTNQHARARQTTSLRCSRIASILKIPDAKVRAAGDIGKPIDAFSSTRWHSIEPDRIFGRNFFMIIQFFPSRPRGHPDSWSSILPPSASAAYIPRVPHDYHSNSFYPANGRTLFARIGAANRLKNPTPLGLS